MVLSTNWNLDMSSHDVINTFFDVLAMATEENTRALAVEAMAVTNSEILSLLTNRELSRYFG